MCGANVNRKKKQTVIAVCGVKNSGKTTFLEKIVGRMTEKGYKTAVIKHDGHDFTCDIPGTDSDRMIKAGAYASAVFSANRVFVHKTGTREREDKIIRMFPEADVIFIEGLKESDYPKIEIIRRGISEYPVSNPDGRFLIVTDHETSRYREETADFEEIDRVIAKILEMNQ